MVGKYTRLFLLNALLVALPVAASGQEKRLEWKFGGSGAAGSADKTTGLRFYELEHGVRAALKEHDGVAGAVVVLPGERMSRAERMKTAAGGIDPERMLTAMAVALVLPMPSDAKNFFVSKEKLKDHLVYRWRASNGAEACAKTISLPPFSGEHDVIFVGPCAEAAKGFVALTPENEGSTINGYERYRPRTLYEIVREHADPEMMTKKEGSMILTGDTLPSKVRVVYTGESRKIPSARKQHMDMLTTSFNVSPKVIEQYGTELLFKEGGDDHWLPVQEKLIPFFEKEVKKGEAVTLYAEWVGAKNIGGVWEWIFIVQEFQK